MFASVAGTGVLGGSDLVVGVDAVAGFGALGGLGLDTETDATVDSSEEEESSSESGAGGSSGKQRRARRARASTSAASGYWSAETPPMPSTRRSSAQWGRTTSWSTYTSSVGRVGAERRATTSLPVAWMCSLRVVLQSADWMLEVQRLAKSGQGGCTENGGVLSPQRLAVSKSAAGAQLRVVGALTRAPPCGASVSGAGAGVQPIASS